MLEVEIIKDIPGFHLDVSFSANKEPVALLGPSGSGKSLTLQCIAGLLGPDSGAITLNGRHLFDSRRGINLPARLRKTGFVFQDYALFPHLNVVDNIAFGIIGSARSMAKESAILLIDKLKLKKLENRYPHQLSGGQQQRVALARALASQPDILLLDEPFSALDAQVKEELKEELGEMGNYYGGNLILITHDIEEAYCMCSTIIVINEGKLVQQGSKEEVLAHPKTIAAAELTGVRNIMEGIVTQVEKRQVKVYTPKLASEFWVLCDAVTLQKGMPVSLGIRSENIFLNTVNKENTVIARLDRMISGLKNNRYMFSIKGVTGEGSLVAELSKELILHHNQDYQLELPMEKMLLFQIR